MTREEFEVRLGVVRSKRPAHRITGRAWPFDHVPAAGQRQSLVWDAVFCHDNGFDHVEAWSRDGRVVAVTSQPYDFVGAKAERAHFFATRYGLKLDVLPNAGWHNPEQAPLLIFTRVDS